MRSIVYYIEVGLICLLLSGCFAEKTTEQNKPLAKPAITSVAAAPQISEVKNVALLLPLEGPLGNAGQAIRDGFITAYRSDSSKNKPAHLIIIDTYNQNIIDAYHKALKADAEVIAGPLEKTDIQTLVQANVIAIPTLALNYLDTDSTTPDQLYQFGLSPLDEARRAAALAKENNGENAIIIVPQGNWGQTIARAYQNEWQALGGAIVTKLFFNNDSATLNQQIQHLITTYSQQFDTILLAASPRMARQIKPLLKFYNAGDIPVYATSLIYAGTPQPAFDNDLNGVEFCDMPWTIGDNPANSKLRQQIELFWSANFKQNARLYALGIDTYQLIKNLAELASSQQTINGATGNLFINSQRLVVRQLICAQFMQGTPKLVSATDDVNSILNDNHNANNDSEQGDEQTIN